MPSDSNLAVRPNGGPSSDTLAVAMQDSSTRVERKSGIDSVVVYTARDSASFSLSAKRMRLRGKATLDYKVQKLEAEIIEMDFGRSTLAASGARDSTKGKYYGAPRFLDRREEFVGESLLFNFTTNQGTINLGETKMEGGYYFGSKVKRVDESVFYVKDGCFTTCSEPHPHFYFGSPKMRVQPGDRVFLDPLIMYVEDIPIFALPFGLFLPNQRGRQSGILVPSVFVGANTGVVFQNLGYYFALSDYYDTRIEADLFTKAGYLLRNTTRYNVNGKFSGDAQLSYGRRNFVIDGPVQTNWQFRGNHRQTIDPQSNITAALDFTSQDFNRNTSVNLGDRIQQLIVSNASYTTSFDNGTTMGLTFARSQNIVTSETQMNPALTFAVPQFFPLRGLVDPNSWLRDVGISYGVNAGYNRDGRRQILGPDTSIAISERYAVRHTPNISVSPRFGVFAVTPSISYSENWYFRRTVRSFNSADSSISESVEHRTLPFREWLWQTGVNVSTRLFGVIKPNLWGLTAVRHTFTPSVSYTLVPEFQPTADGPIREYFDQRQGRTVQYSVFERDGGTGARRRGQFLGYSISNRFEAKLAQGDTIPDKNIDLLQLDLNGSYNFEADSLGLSDISASFRTPAVSFVNFNGSASFTPYREVAIDRGEGRIERSRINQLIAGTSGTAIGRLTNLTLNFSTQFSAGAHAYSTDQKSDTTQVGIGERFSQRYNAEEQVRDFFGDGTPGSSAFGFPWESSMNLTFTYSEPFLGQITRRIDLNGTLGWRLTPTWSLNTNFSYDVVRRELITPALNIVKDMHCWDLRITWFPQGFNQGFYLRFGIKAPQLQDLRLERRSLPVLR